MRPLATMLVCVALLAACDDEVPPEKTETVAGEDHALGGSWEPENNDEHAIGTEDSGLGSSDGPDDTEDPEAECAEEGEACEITDDGWHNCCLGRHTCFPEGCYYTAP